MFSAYSEIVRSVEKNPMPATAVIHFLALHMGSGAEEQRE